MKRNRNILTTLTDRDYQQIQHQWELLGGIVCVLCYLVKHTQLLCRNALTYLNAAIGFSAVVELI